MTIRILLADDHGITRDGLSALLEKETGMIVVGKAVNGRQAVQMVFELQPDVVVMDISMPELNGIEASKQILAQQPKTKIIALSMFSERRYISNMLKAGVSGYLLKNNAFDELVKAIHAVMKNEGFLSQKIAHIVMKEYASPSSEVSVLSSLTSRETEVFQMIAEGLTTKEIAKKLHVSEKTISTHRYQLFKKLNIKNIVQLTKMAIQEGIVSLN